MATSIDDTMRDQEVGTDVILASIVMTAVPSVYDQSCLTLADGEDVKFNLHIASSPFGVGSALLSNESYLFKNLVVKDIPSGCTFDLEFVPPPTLGSLSPDTAVSGDPDFVLSCIGTGLTSKTTINFAGIDEPTTLVSDTEVTTIVKPTLFAPATVPVYVRNGPVATDPLDFTFNPPAEE